ncbi:PAP2 superfamily protein [Chitinophaga sp. CF118]|uniref:phosphatase PAP2 family protein n=1 Tax=Chitinophaga sp. CF118 TaxID=1884367 RepID=UPI0008F140AE|nr:phosphatase PAP2 family protein [Chitinophaga sp. CF118]SFD52427.1 PAP2 superfamily protein [Chitinophaga sp. CF118]
MKIIYSFILGVSLFAHLSSYAQADTTLLHTDSTKHTLTAADTLIRYRLNGTYLRSVWGDLKYSVARPAHWQGRDFAKLGGVLGVAGLLMISDYSVKQVFVHNQQQFWTSVTNEIEPFGNAYSPFLVGGMYLAGVVTHDRKLEHGSLMTAKSLVISTLIYVTAKSVIRRGRPAYYDTPFSYDPPFTTGKEHTSFPSGHMLTVTSVATSLAEIYGKDHPWVPWVTYSIAGLTGVTRMYQNRHWSSDVWIGASLGYFVTKGIYRHHRQQEQKKATLAAMAAAR